MPQVATSGSFKPGVSGNVSGRPAAVRTMTLEARRYGVEAIRAVVKIMRTAAKDSDRLTAAAMLLDRAMGKPQAAIDISVTKQLNQLSDAELQQLEERLAGTMAMAAIEEATPAADLLAGLEDAELGPPIELDLIENEP